MLKYKQVNPLNVFGLRRLEHCPPHFTTINFDLRTSDKIIVDWIYENLEGRFWYGAKYYTHPETKSLTTSKSVGFEIAAEASYFTLILDTINQYGVY